MSKFFLGWYSAIVFVCFFEIQGLGEKTVSEIGLPTFFLYLIGGVGWYFAYKSVSE